MKITTQKFDDYLALIRWDKPIGSLLLLWPTLTAVWVAGAGRPKALVVFVFLLGTFLMRAAGCVINDFADRDFDGHVARTQNRPLPTKKLSSAQALLFFGGIAFLAFLLVLLLNSYTIFLAFVALGITVLYPFLKRFTYWPQLFLGFAFSWGIPMAYAAQLNRVPISAWILFCISLIWTIFYDTQYAMVDREDDVKIGIKSTAILFGDADTLIIAYMQATVLCLLLLFGVINSFNFWYFFSVIVCAALFAYQYILIETRQPENYFKAFLNNNWAWFIIFVGVLLNYLAN